jgi:hypothetical protein
MSVPDRSTPSSELNLSTESPSHLPRWLWALSGFAGLVLVVLGAALAALPFLFPTLFEGVSVISAGYGLVFITLGFALGGAGIRGRRRLPTRRFYSRWAWLFFLAATVAVALLAMLLPRELHNAPIFAPFHVGLILLPGLFLFSLLSLLAGQASAVAMRHLTLATAGGAASVLLAVPVELLGLLFSGVAGLVVAWSIPGGIEEVERLVNLVEAWSLRPPTDELEILSVLASPIILSVLALLLGVIAPLVEEFVKTLVLGVMGIWIKPSVAVSFILGAACGLGFAWLEGISNGGLGLGEPLAWLGGVTVRAFATAMHALASGVIGVGWGYFWRGKRWALPLSYVLAVIFHGLWNLNVVMSLVGMGMTVSAPAVGGLLVVLGLGFQLVLIAICLIALIAIPLRLRRRDEGSVRQIG